MANPFLKFLIMFEKDDGYGWSEVHYLQAGSLNPDLGVALGNFAVNLVPLRAVLLSRDCGVVGMRVSYRRPEKVASLGNRTATRGELTEEGAAQEDSLAVQMQDATGTAKKIIHLRGIWKSIEADGDYIETPAFKPRLTAYLIDGLKGQGYGWLTKDPAASAKGNVTNYVVSADPRVTFTVASTVGVLPAVGELIQVRFSRLNNGSSTLNRTLLCEVVNATTLRTVQRVAAAPFLASGKFNYRATTFVRYNEQGSKSIGERRMGRPLNRLPGRVKARPLA